MTDEERKRLNEVIARRQGECPTVFVDMPEDKTLIVKTDLGDVVLRRVIVPDCLNTLTVTVCGIEGTEAYTGISDKRAAHINLKAEDTKKLPVCPWCVKPIEPGQPVVDDMHLHCSVEEGDGHIIDNEHEG